MEADAIYNSLGQKNLVNCSIFTEKCTRVRALINNQRRAERRTPKHMMRIREMAIFPFVAELMSLSPHKLSVSKIREMIINPFRKMDYQLAAAKGNLSKLAQSCTHRS